MGKKKKRRAAAPVETGQDHRAEERDGAGKKTDAAAPDGVSGDWG